MRVMLSSLRLAACCLITAVMVRPASADEPKPEALQAGHVLDRMAKAYAHCKSYRDSGVVRTMFIEATGKRTVETRFATAVVRPDRFRFEYEAKQIDGREFRCIVWRSGNEVQTWSNVDLGLEKPKSLDSAVAGVVGVSGGSAHTVPALLLPNDVTGRRLTDMTEAKRVEDSKLGKVDCFRIEGNFVKDHPITIWIDKKTFLVRRIDSRQKFAAFCTEETTSYDPVFDEEIPDRKLEFDPPKQK
jgi:outer membrane lipoprotein-sorting protein